MFCNLLSVATVATRPPCIPAAPRSYHAAAPKTFVTQDHTKAALRDELERALGQVHESCAVLSSQPQLQPLGHFGELQLRPTTCPLLQQPTDRSITLRGGVCRREFRHRERGPDSCTPALEFGRCMCTGPHLWDSTFSAPHFPTMGLIPSCAPGCRPQRDQASAPRRHGEQARAADLTHSPEFHDNSNTMRCCWSSVSSLEMVGLRRGRCLALETACQAMRYGGGWSARGGIPCFPQRSSFRHHCNSYSCGHASGDRC